MLLAGYIQDIPGANREGKGKKEQPCVRSKQRRRTSLGPCMRRALCYRNGPARAKTNNFAKDRPTTSPPRRLHPTYFDKGLPFKRNIFRRTTSYVKNDDKHFRTNDLARVRKDLLSTKLKNGTLNLQALPTASTFCCVSFIERACCQTPNNFAACRRCSIPFALSIPKNYPNASRKSAAMAAKKKKAHVVIPWTPTLSRYSCPHLPKEATSARFPEELSW